MNIWKTLAVYQAIEELSHQYSEALIITEDIVDYTFTLVSSRASQKLEKLYEGIEMSDKEVWDTLGELIVQDVIVVGYDEEAEHYYIQIVRPLPLEG